MYDHDMKLEVQTVFLASNWCGLLSRAMSSHVEPSPGVTLEEVALRCDVKAGPQMRSFEVTISQAKWRDIMTSLAQL